MLNEKVILWHLMLGNLERLETLWEILFLWLLMWDWEARNQLLWTLPPALLSNYKKGHLSRGHNKGAGEQDKILHSGHLQSHVIRCKVTKWKYSLDITYMTTAKWTGLWDVHINFMVFWKNTMSHFHEAGSGLLSRKNILLHCIFTIRKVWSFGWIVVSAFYMSTFHSLTSNLAYQIEIGAYF